MIRNSELSVFRPVLPNEECERFTAQLNHYATETFGHDGASRAIDSSGKLNIPVGNPRFKLLTPLQYCLLYRSARTDGRSKTSSYSRATNTVFKQDNPLKAVHRRYDGIVPERIGLYFKNVGLGTKPSYQECEKQLVLLSDVRVEETGLLLEEAQVLSNAFANLASRVGQPEVPLLPGVPFLRLDQSVEAKETGDFIDKLVANRVLPVRLVLGRVSTAASDNKTL